MANEMVVSQDEKIVLQTKKDEFLSKIENLQKNNLTAKQQEEIASAEKGFCLGFLNLAYSFIGFSEEQLKEFSNEELKQLIDIVTKKAKPWAIAQLTFFLIPIIGWMGFVMVGFENKDNSLFFLKYRKKLIKMCGDDYIPLKKLREYID